MKWIENHKVRMFKLQETPPIARNPSLLVEANKGSPGTRPCFRHIRSKGGGFLLELLMYSENDPWNYKFIIISWLSLMEMFPLLLCFRHRRPHGLSEVGSVSCGASVICIPSMSTFFLGLKTLLSTKSCRRATPMVMCVCVVSGGVSSLFFYFFPPSSFSTAVICFVEHLPIGLPVSCLIKKLQGRTLLLSAKPQKVISSLREEAIDIGSVQVKKSFWIFLFCLYGRKWYDFWKKFLRTYLPQREST